MASKCPACGRPRDEVLMPPQGWFTHGCAHCGDGPFIETTRGEIIRSSDLYIKESNRNDSVVSEGSGEAELGPVD